MIAYVILAIFFQFGLMYLVRMPLLKQLRLTERCLKDAERCLKDEKERIDYMIRPRWHCLACHGSKRMARTGDFTECAECHTRISDEDLLELVHAQAKADNHE